MELSQISNGCFCLEASSFSGKEQINLSRVKKGNVERVEHGCRFLQVGYCC